MPTWGQIRDALGETYRQVDEATGGYLPYGAPPYQSEPAAPDLGGGRTRPEAKAQEYLKDKIEKVKRSSLEESDKPTPLVHPPFLASPGTIIKESMKGWKGVGTALSTNPAGKAVVDYIQDIPNRGAIPVPTFNKDVHGVLTGVKGITGAAGMPFRLTDNPDTSRYYQEQVDLASEGFRWQHGRPPGPGDTISWGGRIHNTETGGTTPGNPMWYSRKAIDMNQGAGDRSFGRGLAGQVNFEVQPDGSVVHNDLFDTNHSSIDHIGSVAEELSKGNLSQAGYYGTIGLPVAVADEFGFINKHPNGRDVPAGRLR